MRNKQTDKRPNRDSRVARAEVRRIRYHLAREAGLGHRDSQRVSNDYHNPLADMLTTFGVA